MIQTNRLAKFILAALASTLAACAAPVDTQCLTDLEASHGTFCGNASQCPEGLTCGSPRPGDPSVCHAAIACTSSADCRGVRLCGVATLCTANSTGLNSCLPMGFGDAGGVRDAAADGPADGGLDASDASDTNGDATPDVARDAMDAIGSDATDASDVGDDVTDVAASDAAD